MGRFATTFPEYAGPNRVTAHTDARTRDRFNVGRAIVINYHPCHSTHGRRGGGDGVQEQLSGVVVFAQAHVAHATVVAVEQEVSVDEAGV